MKFKVGDKVRIKENLQLGKVYGSMGINDDMFKMKGSILTIKKTHNSYYNVKENCWNWTDKMFKNETNYTIKDLIKMLKEC